MTLIAQFDKHKGEISLIGWHAFFEAQRLGVSFRGMWKMDGDTTWENFVAKLEVSKTQVRAKDIMRDNKYLRVTLMCNIVHNHGVVTYDVLVGKKSVEQTGKFEEAVAAYDAL